MADKASDGRQRRRKSLLVYADDAPRATMVVKSPWEGASNALPGVVLDTNAVLDWLVFGDPGMAAVAAAIQAGEVRWLVCPRMRDELMRALGYASLAKWQPDAARVLAQFDQLAITCAQPTTAPTTPRCTDTDDQVFIDLALATRAQCLLTHDRALLKLARKAHTLSLHIEKPTDWRRAT
jgi:uncharacterized protein